MDILESMTATERAVWTAAFGAAIAMDPQPGGVGVHDRALTTALFAVQALQTVMSDWAEGERE